jgi:hypothetical protein
MVPALAEQSLNSRRNLVPMSPFHPEPTSGTGTKRQILSTSSLGTKSIVLTFPGQALRRSALSAPFRRLAELVGFGDIRIATA